MSSSRVSIPASYDLQHSAYPSFTVTTRISSRAKRLSLYLHSHKGLVELVIPKGLSWQKALQFLESRHAWIAHHMPTIMPRIVLEDGISVPVMGEILQIRHTGTVRGLAYREGDLLYISGMQESFSRRVTDYLKQQLFETLTRLTDEKTTLLGVKYQSIRVKDMHTRWGSCNVQGQLHFAWRLVFAPFAIIDYLVAHEVAHLLEMNHSPRFWKIVSRLCPEYATHRAWLKSHGYSLFHYV